MVEGARFCHKCGRPTSEEQEPEVSIPKMILEPPVLPAGGFRSRSLGSGSHEPVEANRVSFGNPAALRISFAAASLSILLDSIPFLSLLFIIWSMGAGFMAVWMYGKRTGQGMSVSSGAKLGWITGVFTFVILTILITVGALLSGGKWSEEYRQSISAMAVKDPNYQQVLHLLDNPTSLALFILLSLFIGFVLLSLASVAGGALGARFSNKD